MAFNLFSPPGNDHVTYIPPGSVLEKNPTGVCWDFVGYMGNVIAFVAQHDYVCKHHAGMINAWPFNMYCLGWCHIAYLDF